MGTQKKLFMITILVTGGAGFIGSSLIDELLKDEKYKIISIDNFDTFYDRTIKLKHIEKHKVSKNFEFHEIDIKQIDTLTTKNPIDVIVHLAGKAGVRPSINDSIGYFNTNLMGTISMLEFAKKKNIKQFVFGSSSSVYGNSKAAIFSEDDPYLFPISPYASSKLSAEKAGFTYSHLYDIRFIALRFFTVFGPRQRPDLAINKFMSKILNQDQIEVYGNGSTSRDYTYITDIVSGIISSIEYSKSQFEIFNLGNNKPIKLIDLINEIALVTNIKPNLKFIDEQEGDVSYTCADINKACKYLAFNPLVTFSEGIRYQYEWFIKNKTHD